MTFQLEQVTKLHCVHVNIRRELHGEDNVPAIDLAVRKEGGNELLDLLDPSIRQALYFNAAAANGQEQLPEVLAILPNLRLPKLNACKFSWAKGEKHKGYRVVVDYGLGEQAGSNIDLDDCAVHSWTFEVKEGGSVVLDWKVSYAGEKLTPSVRGLLTGLTDMTVFMQIIAPPVLQIVKGKPKVAGGDGAPDGQGELGDGDEEGGAGGDGEGLDPGTPEAALAGAVGNAQ